MASRKDIRSTRKTILIVCEGKRDQAFLVYLRGLYSSGSNKSPSVDIKQAKGKGGNNVVQTLLGSLKVKDYDTALAFLEADCPPDAKNIRALMKVKKGCKKIKVFADPCLEGLFLQILNIPYPIRTSECKQRVDGLTQSDLYHHRDYADFMPKELLDTHLQRLTDVDDFKILIDQYKLRAQG